MISDSRYAKLWKQEIPCQPDLFVHCKNQVRRAQLCMTISDGDRKQLGNPGNAAQGAKSISLPPKTAPRLLSAMKISFSEYAKSPATPYRHRFQAMHSFPLSK